MKIFQVYHMPQARASLFTTETLAAAFKTEMIARGAKAEDIYEDTLEVLDDDRFDMELARYF